MAIKGLVGLLLRGRHAAVGVVATDEEPTPRWLRRVAEENEGEEDEEDEDEDEDEDEESA